MFEAHPADAPRNNLLSGKSGQEAPPAAGLKDVLATGPAADDLGPHSGVLEVGLEYELDHPGIPDLVLGVRLQNHPLRALPPEQERFQFLFHRLCTSRCPT